CGGEFWARDHLAGHTIHCPACEALLTVPTRNVVESTMVPVTCRCGEVFWAATWRPGRRSRCPACNGAVTGPTQTLSDVKEPVAPSAGPERLSSEKRTI